MAFVSLGTASFRNLCDGRVSVDAKEVFLIGENGQGKTNFLEALYYCSYASSFRGVADSEIARSGETSFSATAELKFEQDNISGFNRHILIKTEKAKKTVSIDGKKITDRKDILKIIPTIIFCHEDMEFVSSSQERRRWFFDQTLSLYDTVYLDDLRKYRRVLKTRNTVLKETKERRIGIHSGGIDTKTEELLDAIDPQLKEYGERLMEKRNAATEQFSAVFTPLYREVSGISGITVNYAPSWKKHGTTQHLEERRATDTAQGITLSGPHRDKYYFRHNGTAKDFSGTASTGQRRLLSLLLRTAQARGFYQITGKTPILLLDDVLLELDGEKRRRFISLMPDYEQAFFAFLPEEPYKSYGKKGSLIYRVQSGTLTGDHL